MKTEFENRKEFLNTIKNDLQSCDNAKIFYLLEKAIKTKNKELISYEKIVSIGASKTNEVYNKDDYFSLLKKIYSYWWSNAILQKYNTISNKENTLKKFVLNEDFNPKNINKEDIEETLGYIENFLFCGVMPPVYFQEDNFCQFYVNEFSLERQKLNKPVQTRLYLNIKSTNIMKVAEKLIDMALEDNTPLLFKVALKNGRNDNVVLYTNYEDIYSTLKLVEKVKNNNPKLFAGCNVKNPFMAKIKNYIGYGDEPFSYGSFNSVRVDALRKCYDILVKKFDNVLKITKEDIILVFNKVCSYFQIDKDNFYLNSEERDFSILKEYENN